MVFEFSFHKVIPSLRAQSPASQLVVRTHPHTSTHPSIHPFIHPSPHPTLLYSPLLYIQADQTRPYRQADQTRPDHTDRQTRPYIQADQTRPYRQADQTRPDHTDRQTRPDKHTYRRKHTLYTQSYMHDTLDCAIGLL